MNIHTQGRHWLAAGEGQLADMIRLRRAIHADPEIGLQTPRTATRAREALDGLPLEFREGPSTSGFIAILRGAHDGPTVLLRGDMDALPLHEDTGLAFASQTAGVMHACGHDTHVAMLVGAARALCARRETLRGTVLFMFQPGEEGWHGARYMLEDGLLDPLPQAAFALHITPNVPTGVFTGRPGSLMAASDRFVVHVTGRGGHASQPQEAVDPVPIACEIGTAIQAMVTRRIPAFDPVVITVARITAGTTDNIIPETAELEGTIRSLSESSRALARDGLRRLASAIAAAHLAEATVDIVPGFPLTVCDAGATTLARVVAEDLFGQAAWQPMAHPMMSAEDFSYVLQKIPGVMVFLGATPNGGDWRTCCPLHSNRIVLDEGVMARGVAMHCAFADRFLSCGFDVASM